MSLNHAGEVVVVGTGPGGATVARELASRGVRVTILESGRPGVKFGTEMGALGFYDGRTFGAGRLSEGREVEFFRAKVLGGTATVSLGCALSPPGGRPRGMGFDLGGNLSEARRDMKVVTTPEEFIGPRSSLIRRAGEELGYEFRPMPKSVKFDRCTGCGNCVLGCVEGAKWTPVRYLAEAARAGARIMTGYSVTRVASKSGEVTSVAARGPTGGINIPASVVVLAAGALETPVILQNSGVDAGGSLSGDLFVNCYGMIDGRGMGDEMGMTTLMDGMLDRGFLLSPILDTPLDMFLYFPTLKKLRSLRRSKMIGLMVKTSDDVVGGVTRDGRIRKTITRNDERRLREGEKIARAVLEAAGCNPGSIMTGRVRAAHPACTAPVGEVVDREQETEISGLFVGDASAFPAAPGIPPIVTIVAMSKRLGRILTDDRLNPS